MALVFLAAGFTAFAQETGDPNSGQTDTQRPPETELLLDNPAAPAAANGDAAPEAELPGIGFGDFARMVLVLGIVIALIYGFFWMLKRFSGVKGESEDAIKLLSTRPLKGDAALHLVEVGTRLYLVGSGGNAVNLVSEIDDKESIDAIRLEISRTPKTAPGSFARLFKDRFGSGPVSGEAPGTADGGSDAGRDDPASFLKRQKERLKDL